MAKRRGNPNWGRPVRAVPALPSQFELLIHQLKLRPEMYISSRELRVWCERNRNHSYIPEWLIEEWELVVDITFGFAT